MVRETCKEYGLQYIFTLIDSDLPCNEVGQLINFPASEVVLRLNDKDEKGNIAKNKFGDLIYSKEYATKLHAALNGMVESQMRKAIVATTNFWYTAWVDAGQPDLSKLQNIPPSPELLKELEAFVKENKVNIKVLVINNSCQLMVKMWQDKFYDKRQIGVKMNNPDFENVAKSLGCASVRIQFKNQFQREIKYFLDYIIFYETNNLQIIVHTLWPTRQNPNNLMIKSLI